MLIYTPRDQWERVRPHVTDEPETTGQIAARAGVRLTVAIVGIHYGVRAHAVSVTYRPRKSRIVSLYRRVVRHEL